MAKLLINIYIKLVSLYVSLMNFLLTNLKINGIIEKKVIPKKY